MPTVTILDANGQQSGTLELDAKVFGAEPRGPLLHQAVVRELADRRVGTHDTKGRSEVSGGGKKPWRQKGTGRARQGSTRATQWKGGGKPFGPTPRSYDQRLTRAMRRGALRDAVSARLGSDEVKVIEAIDASDGKTRSLVTRLKAVGVAPVPTVLVVNEFGDMLRRASRNLSWLQVETPTHLSVYQLMAARQVVFERGALVTLEEALRT
jgi:large subunit ribosomal protein L4